MNRIFARKWPVGVAVLVLVLALGAVAWAATDGTATSRQEPAEIIAHADDAGLEGFGLFPGPGRPGGRGLGHGLLGSEGVDLPADVRERIEERRQRMEYRAEAFLNLIREKMSAEDQEKLDGLVAQAKEDRQALEQARGDARETGRQLRELIAKYFPREESGASTSTTQQ